MVGISGLQRTHQEFELGKYAQSFETRVIQEKWPACESGADTALKPLKSDFASSCESENASDLIVSVMGMPK
jgi:hypothetical protein